MCVCVVKVLILQRRANDQPTHSMASTSPSSQTIPRILYRSLLRELRATPTNPSKVTLNPSFQSQPIVQHVRQSFRSRKVDLREMQNLETYLRSNRMHKVRENLSQINHMTTNASSSLMRLPDALTSIQSTP